MKLFHEAQAPGQPERFHQSCGSGRCLSFCRLVETTELIPTSYSENLKEIAPQGFASSVSHPIGFGSSHSHLASARCHELNSSKEPFKRFPQSTLAPVHLAEARCE